MRYSDPASAGKVLSPQSIIKTARQILPEQLARRNAFLLIAAGIHSNETVSCCGCADDIVRLLDSLLINITYGKTGASLLFRSEMTEREILYQSSILTPSDRLISVSPLHGPQLMNSCLERASGIAFDNSSGSIIRIFDASPPDHPVPETEIDDVSDSILFLHAAHIAGLRR